MLPRYITICVILSLILIRVYERFSHAFFLFILSAMSAAGVVLTKEINILPGVIWDYKES